MPANPPDFTKYAQMLQQTMADAIAEAESMTQMAAAERETAADLWVSRKSKLNELEGLARQAATAYLDTHLKEIKEKIRQELQTLIAAKLLRSGRDQAFVAGLLEVPEDWVALVGNQ